MVAVDPIEAFTYLDLKTGDLLTQGVDGFAVRIDLDIGIADPLSESSHGGQHRSVVGAVCFQRGNAGFEVGK